VSGGPATVGSVILVTGATGNVGRNVVSGLVDAGVEVRAISRHASVSGLPPRVDVVEGDLSDPDVLVRSLADVDTVFLIWKQVSTRNHPAAIDALARHVRRVVYVSSLHVDDDADEQLHPMSQTHADIERRIQRSGLAWTFLRAAWLASNAHQWAEEIRAGDVVRIPNAASSRSPIDPRDVAAVGVCVVTEPGHDGAKHVLTGPERMTEGKVVLAVGDAVGRSIRLDEVPPGVARQEMLDEGLPAAFVEATMSAWARLVEHPEPITTTVEDVTARPPRTFRVWAADHLDAFR